MLRPRRIAASMGATVRLSGAPEIGRCRCVTSTNGTTVQILIADDEPVTRHLLQSLLESWGHRVVTAADGGSAWAILSQPDAPRLAILDWVLPDFSGVEVCRRVRECADDDHPTYLIVLTARSAKADLVKALDAGADDFLTKPFHAGELRARVSTGVRIVELQARLSARVSELEASLRREEELLGLLPLCSYCRKVRDDGEYWRGLEEYLASLPDVRFSHSICPSCYETHLEGELGPMDRGELKGPRSQPETAATTPARGPAPAEPLGEDIPTNDGDRP